MNVEKPAVINSSMENIKKNLLESVSSPEDPRVALKLYNEAVSAFKNGKQEEREKLLKDVSDKMGTAINVLGLETHFPIAEAITRNRTLVIEFANQLIKEYDCRSPSEKSLAEVVSLSYGQLIEFTKILNNCQRLDYLSHEKNGYYSMISKEVDRANRHYLSALSMLKQIKSPEIKVSVKANTAFIGQNQLNNNTYENIKE